MWVLIFYIKFQGELSYTGIIDFFLKQVDLAGLVFQKTLHSRRKMPIRYNKVMMNFSAYVIFNNLLLVSS